MTLGHLHVGAIALEAHEVLGSLGEPSVIEAGDSDIRTQRRKAAYPAGEARGDGDRIR
jgi:hypothetical protein